MQNAECRTTRISRQICLSVFLLCFLRGFLSVPTAVAAEPAAEFKLETLRGKVVFLGEALQRRAGIATVFEAKDRVLAIETKAGELIPLIEDPRGRAFRSDVRLRKMEVELLVRRYKVTSAVQIIRVFEIGADGSRFEIDYWCDVCSIVMYELKDCECCQGPIELRRNRVP